MASVTGSSNNPIEPSRFTLPVTTSEPASPASMPSAPAETQVDKLRNKANELFEELKSKYPEHKEEIEGFHEEFELPQVSVGSTDPKLEAKFKGFAKSLESFSKVLASKAKEVEQSKNELHQTLENVKADLGKLNPNDPDASKIISNCNAGLMDCQRILEKRIPKYAQEKVRNDLDGVSLQLSKLSQQCTEIAAHQPPSSTQTAPTKSSSGPSDVNK